jgi:NADPH:quinone reductase-like Zn-dependent oxidoreductase
VGAGVTRAAAGDAVVLTYVVDWWAGPATEATARRRRALNTPGVFRELMVVPEAEVVRAPRGWSAAESATLPIAATTAWHALVVDGGVTPGEDVVVQGTGGVSLFALDFARLAGARVWMVTRSDRHTNALRARGAAGVLAVGSREDWSRAVLEKTDRRGADRVVDVVGGVGLNQSVAATRIGGTVHLVGFVGGGAATVDLVAAIRRVVTIRAASVGSRDSLESLIRAMETGGVRPVIERVFERREVQEAFRHLERGGHLGKVVVEM